MKRIAIFGGSGFIGTNLINTLSSLNCEIHNYDLVDCHSDVPNYYYTFIDIRDDANDYTFLSDFNYVYILSALLGKRCANEPINGWETNVKGLTTILFSISQLKSKPIVIFPSSAMVYDKQVREVPILETATIKGDGLYEQSKIIIESIIQSACLVFNLKAIIFRFFTVYGPGPASAVKGHFIPTWISQAQESNRITIYGNGQQTIDLTHVNDVVHALVAVLDYKLPLANPEILNIATGIETKVNDIANWFKDHKPDLELSYIPVTVEYPKRKYADIKKAEALLGYKPTISPEDGIKALLKNIS